MKLAHSISLNCKRKQSGVATVEMAIVIPILTLLLLASAEYGRVYYHLNEFTKSVRNAARYASNNALNSSMVMDINNEQREKIKNLLIYGDVSSNMDSMFQGLSYENIIILENDPYISVIATWEYKTIFGSSLPSFGLSSGDTVVLAGSSSMIALE